MALTKASRTLLASQSLAAGASIFREVDLTLRIAGRIFVKITNGASAPTTAPQVNFTVGEASGVKRKHYSAGGDTVANSLTEVDARYGLSDMWGGVTVVNGLTNAITIEIYATDATA